jgi:hypothetical protein
MLGAFGSNLFSTVAFIDYFEVLKIFRANAHRKNVIDNQLVIFVIQPSLFFFKRVLR